MFRASKTLSGLLVALIKANGTQRALGDFLLKILSPADVHVPESRRALILSRRATDYREIDDGASAKGSGVLTLSTNLVK